MVQYFWQHDIVRALLEYLGINVNIDNSIAEVFCGASFQDLSMAALTQAIEQAQVSTSNRCAALEDEIRHVFVFP